MDEARTISSAFANIRFSDIAPRDVEAEEHARQHLEMQEEEDGVDLPEEVDQKRRMEGLEDMLNRLSAGAITSTAEPSRPTMDDVHALKDRLDKIIQQTDLNMNWS